jgi:hypothetical protein
MGVVGMKTFFVPLLISIGLLSSCASTSGTGSSNFVCASVEQYLDNKAFALQSAASGGSAEESVSAIVGQLSQSVGDDSEARLIFEKFLDSMTAWSQRVDSYILTQNNEDLTEAAVELEKQIDEIIPLCEAAGWSFQEAWR